ncbi:hypothetical protein FHS26_004319 [Rhizobium pisi]|uniref:Uncharacterized protein n=1 Tax=Rhizobium pisi TaxID=574561 RepID=A0A3R9GYJ1_9HYPH|nr:hypothetical protein [Rhizobium pisi]MBB3136564.1 hypothetical protein [Rhizobium pisi]RSB67125.1 hypothetical protein EFD55_21680 [Rhizobium pisi]TCA53813.1 hypothetical protein E0J16_17675 [Rhizobium pisi]
MTSWRNGPSKSNGVAKLFYLESDPTFMSASNAGPRMPLILRLLGAEAFAAGAAPIVVKVHGSGLIEAGDPKPRWGNV